MTHLDVVYLAPVMSKLILSGTLQHDVREELIKEVTRRGWQHSLDVEFPTLANMPAFKGHTPNSLCHLYNSMLGQVVMRESKKGVKLAIREVTVTLVDEWWNTRKVISKSEEKKRWEEELVSAFNVVVRDLGLEQPDL